jgi:hypothetical protein
MELINIYAKMIPFRSSRKVSLIHYVFRRSSKGITPDFSTKNLMETIASFDSFAAVALKFPIILV